MMFHQSDLPQNTQNKFHANETLRAHYDGKLLEDLTTKKSVDRLSVLVYGLRVNRH